MHYSLSKLFQVFYIFHDFSFNHKLNTIFHCVKTRFFWVIMSLKVSGRRIVREIPNVSHLNSCWLLSQWSHLGDWRNVWCFSDNSSARYITRHYNSKIVSVLTQLKIVFNLCFKANTIKLSI